MKPNLLIALGLVAIVPACQTNVKQGGEVSEGFVIHRGVNVSHWLSQTEMRGEERAQYMQAADFEKISELGFDHVRIPIDEAQMWDEAGEMHRDAFDLLHKAIRWSFENNLRVIVDLHILRSHYFNADVKPLWTDPAAQEEFLGFWKQLSNELHAYPVDKLAYELMNEAVSDDPEDWNRLLAKGIETVRALEPERVIVVGSNKWQQVGTFKDLKVPGGDSNLLLSFHFYDPFLLTHYRAPWTGALAQFEGEVRYPGFTVDTMEYANLAGDVLDRVRGSNGYWDAARIEEAFMQARAVADSFGLPLFCGEFGCFPSKPPELRNAYYRDIISVFDKLDISWTHWNYKNDFPVVDEKTLEPIEAVVSALIGE
jgi:endoglucanase